MYGDGERTPRSPPTRLPNAFSNPSSSSSPEPRSINEVLSTAGPSRDPSSSPDYRPTRVPRLTNGPGYLDPQIPSPKARKKGKERAKGGRKYAAIPTVEEEGDEEEPPRGRYAGFGVVDPRSKGLRKSGLSSYEKALWRWVNVDDLDGFLQEVSYGFTETSRRGGKGFGKALQMMGERWGGRHCSKSVTAAGRWRRWAG